MKKIIVLVGVVLSCCFVSPAYSVEACFDPGTQYYNMNGHRSFEFVGDCGGQRQ